MLIAVALTLWRETRLLGCLRLVVWLLVFLAENRFVYGFLGIFGGNPAFAVCSHFVIDELLALPGLAFLVENRFACGLLGVCSNPAFAACVRFGIHW